jgi:hypothetical protein
MVKYLVDGKVPERDTLIVGAEVIFRSNLRLFTETAGLPDSGW